RYVASIIIFLCAPLWLSSTIWEVNQGGGGDFTTVQAGIDAAANLDTVLVYPGIYYENIDYMEKSLTVASLYMVTPEDSLINQTVIDGNEQFRCVTIEDCGYASLIGFTLQNGKVLGNGWTSGSGGGLLIDNVLSSFVSYCKIKNNKAITGGGLYIINAEALLSGNIISHNWGIQLAGGFCFTGYDTNIQFSETDLNSIFLNYSATGSDIYIGYSIQGIVDIIVDTLTVNEPDYFFIGPLSQCIISQQNAKIEEIDQDLYLAPDGDDANNGTSPDEPLQTLAWAQTVIKRNDDDPHTIHLAEGVYSPLLNNQVFPMNIKKGVTFEGLSPDNTILDAESESPFFYQFSPPQEEFSTLIMKNITLMNGIGETHGGGVLIYQADLHLDNMVIENCIGDWAGAIQLENGYCDLNSIKIRNNNGTCAVSFSTEHNNPNPVCNKKIKNSIITDNLPNILDPDFPGGGAFRVSGHSNIPGEYYAEFINCEISGNRNATYDPLSGLGGAAAMSIDDYIEVDIVNCTIGDNILDYNTGCSISVDNNSTVNVYNSILYDNDGYSFIMMQEATANISHSIIEGGDDNIRYYYPLAIVNWNEGNLSEDPLWTQTGDYPYYLQTGSSCIDAGTLELPDGVELPEYDLVGNPRIHGETVDMGAYEWQGVENSDELEVLSSELSNYPNPFNPSTTIKLQLAEAGKVELSIYNIKGQKVETLMDCTTTAGTFNCNWNGRNESGKRVASGQYIVKLNVNGEERASLKMTMLK
ncbi:MAG TPA: FlgD immunoglobulin-like domain containing protein, partial [Candidatus Cloacimonadota bacterium]|nr:FlgD immunoglobulin-like domain containing protein [Candidatus Cloacimonadota bacterium]